MSMPDLGAISFLNFFLYLEIFLPQIFFVCKFLRQVRLIEKGLDQVFHLLIYKNTVQFKL